MTSGTVGSNAEKPQSVTTEIEPDRTVVVVEGTRDVAVVVNSAAGERVYLPPAAPEGEERSGAGTDADSAAEAVPTESPYEGVPTESPYDGIAADTPYTRLSADSSDDAVPTESPYDGVPTDSPYEGLSDDTDDESTDPVTATGVVPTQDGFRIVHPEPATDVRFLR
ncbi:MAG: hypothetical protein ABEJ47_02815 [Halorhabdus sp.]